MNSELYFSVDIEIAGPIPGKYSMLSLGACVVGMPDKSFYVELKPISKEFIPEAIKVLVSILRNWKKTALLPK